MEILGGFQVLLHGNLGGSLQCNAAEKVFGTYHYAWAAHKSILLFFGGCFLGGFGVGCSVCVCVV